MCLGVLLASFWMLLRPSSPPIRCSRVFQNGLLTTFASQTSISRKCYYSVRNIVVFDTRRGGFGSSKSSRGRSRVCETTSPKSFDRDETRRKAINRFKTNRIYHRQRLLNASEDPWDLQGTRQGSENEPTSSSPLASSLASKIVPAPRREHDFALGYLGFF